jgi:hypothetical protein
VEEEGRGVFKGFQKGIGVRIIDSRGRSSQECSLLSNTGPLSNLVRNRDLHLREFNPETVLIISMVSLACASLQLAGRGSRGSHIESSPWRRHRPRHICRDVSPIIEFTSALAGSYKVDLPHFLPGLHTYLGTAPWLSPNFR